MIPVPSQLGPSVDPAASVLMTQATFAFLAVRALEWVKRAKQIPWVSRESRKLNRALAIVLAFLAQHGVHVLWHADWTAGNFGFSLSGLTPAVLGLIAWGTLKSYVAQQLFFQTTVRYPANGAPPAPPATAPETNLPTSAKSAI